LPIFTKFFRAAGAAAALGEAASGACGSVERTPDAASPESPQSRKRGRL